MDNNDSLAYPTQTPNSSHQLGTGSAARGGSSAGVLRFYTDEAPGLRV